MIIVPCCNKSYNHEAVSFSFELVIRISFVFLAARLRGMNPPFVVHGIYVGFVQSQLRARQFDACALEFHHNPAFVLVHRIIFRSNDAKALYGESLFCHNFARRQQSNFIRFKNKGALVKIYQAHSLDLQHVAQGQLELKQNT